MKISFLGDSITEGVGASTREKSYPYLTCQYLHADIDCNGISGTRIAKNTYHSDNPRFDIYFHSRVNELAKDSDILVLFGGTNDYGHGEAPFGDYLDHNDDTFCGAFRCLLEDLVKIYGKDKIVVILPLPRFGGKEASKDPNVAHVKKYPLEDYVNTEKKMCEEFGVSALDYFHNEILMHPSTTEHTGFFADGLHPGDLGHEILARYLAAFIKTKLN